MFRPSTNFNSLVVMVRLALFSALELESSPLTPALIVICLVIFTLSEEMVRLPSFCEILPPIWISAWALLSVMFKSPFVSYISGNNGFDFWALVVIFKLPLLVISPRRFTTPCFILMSAVPLLVKVPVMFRLSLVSPLKIASSSMSRLPLISTLVPTKLKFP